MSDVLFVSILFFIVIYVSFLTGMYAGSLFKKNFLSDESKRAIDRSIKLVASTTALILGLLIASSYDSFKTYEKSLSENAINILTLDRLLANYGEETTKIRTEIKAIVGQLIQREFNDEQEHLQTIFKSNTEKIMHEIRLLHPKNELQTQIKVELINQVRVLLNSRWISIHGIGRSLPPLFLGMLLFWTAFSFFFFGMLAPNNRTVKVVYLLGCLSVASSIFIIIELDNPFRGIIFAKNDSIIFIHDLLGK